jgi:hypothetical protein
VLKPLAQDRVPSRWAVSYPPSLTRVQSHKFRSSKAGGLAINIVMGGKSLQLHGLAVFAKPARPQVRKAHSYRSNCLLHRLKILVSSRESFNLEPSSAELPKEAQFLDLSQDSGEVHLRPVAYGREPEVPVVDVLRTGRVEPSDVGEQVSPDCKPGSERVRGHG